MVVTQILSIFFFQFDLYDQNMEKQQDLQSLSVIWRGQKFVVEMNQGATLKELGDKLRELTHVEADTLRLLVPVEKNSKLLYPFSDEHSRMSLGTASIVKVQRPLFCLFCLTMFPGIGMAMVLTVQSVEGIINVNAVSLAVNTFFVNFIASFSVSISIYNCSTFT